MASFIIQQKDINAIRQKERIIYSKVELLNHNFKILDSLQGNLISDSFTINAESDIRRIYNLELHITNSSFFIGSEKKFWIDRYIRPYVGIKYLRTNEILWYCMGTFVINDNDITYDKTTKTLSLTCSDLMCTLNGDRGGEMSGLSNVIPEGTYIRNAIIGLLDDAGIKRYKVEDIGRTIPYDLEYSVGSTYYQALKDIVDLYAGYEMFFDIDGTFVVQAIPTTKNEPSMLDETIINPLVISERIKDTFNRVRNKTEIWGAVIDADYYTQNVTTDDSITYNASFDGVSELDNFGKYSLRIPTANMYGAVININGLGNLLIMNDDGFPIDAERLEPNTDYVFKYRKATNDLLLLGQYQAYGEYTCTDIDCPYSTTNLGYEIKQVMQFEELESDSLCKQRAKYETWLATRMQDQLELNMVSIPFLDVNWKISYVTDTTHEKGDYIVKSISGSTSSGLMDVTLIRYSELYPDII